MRAKARRYAASIASATVASGTDILGVTGDFEGGFVQANVRCGLSVGAGAWMTLVFRVDGVSQGPTYGTYQSGANMAFAMSASLRVPPGRHRVSVALSSSAAPAAGQTNADLDVVETGA